MRRVHLEFCTFCYVDRLFGGGQALFVGKELCVGLFLITRSNLHYFLREAFRTPGESIVCNGLQPRSPPTTLLVS
jgi:hypothetical protein